METRWFTSDEHYGHHRVIEFCNRPFKDIDEMREEIIRRHNEVVSNGDLVFHLGDMFWRTVPVSEAIDIVRRLKGNHYYIFGNHEELMERSPELRAKFVWTKERVNLHRPNGYPNIVLDHYAGRVWNGSHRGTWQLYGHSHNSLSCSVAGGTPDESALSFDVGVDCWDYYPVSIEQVAEKMRSKGWVS